MAADRFKFHRGCVEKTTGKVLNVGCKEDPSNLKGSWSDRVINMDIRDFDHDVFVTSGNKIAIPVDVLHDATQAPWPFADDEFEMVVLGDILEDLPDDGCQLILLSEARRVARKLCITTPEDTTERDWHHLTTITEEILREWLAATEWNKVDLQVVDYGFVPRGYFVYAERGGETMATVIVCDKNGCEASFQPTEGYTTLLNKTNQKEYNLCSPHALDFEAWLNASFIESGPTDSNNQAQAEQVSAPVTPVEGAQAEAAQPAQPVDPNNQPQ